jgi:hypothetical protein
MVTNDKAVNKYHREKAKVKPPESQEMPGDMPRNFDILGTFPLFPKSTIEPQ